MTVVEDDPRYRGSLEELFSHATGFSLAASFGSATAAVRSAEEATSQGKPAAWDIVVMDLELPGMNGIEATRKLKKILPGVPVVVLTVFEEPNTVLEAICAGASGYLLKKTPAGELLAHLKSISAGGSALTPDVARTVLDLLRRTGDNGSGGPGRTQPARLDLTDREQEVLRGLVKGLAYKQIGVELGISIDTVRTHIRSVYQKLQVHSVAEAVTRAIREKIV